jgi:hypothetical protein
MEGQPHAHLYIRVTEAPMGHDRRPLCHRLCLIHLVYQATASVCKGNITVGAHCCSSIKARKTSPYRRDALTDVDVVQSTTTVFLTQLMQPK